MSKRQQQYHDAEYMDIMDSIIHDGIHKGDRTGTGTLSTFGQMGRFDLTDGKLPLITTKKIFHRSFIHETLWFISGSTDIEYLKKQNISIWDSWVDKTTARYDGEGKLIGGSIGPGAYGSMWRNIDDTRIVATNEVGEYQKKGFRFVDNVMVNRQHRSVVTRKIDQLQQAIDLLRTNPDSRRIIVHAFDNRMIDFCQLPPCHSWFQFWSRELSAKERIDIYEARGNAPVGMMAEDTLLPLLETAGVPKRALKCLLMQRSADYPVGAPFNIAQYALLTHMVAHITGMVAEEFIWVGGDVHIYDNQLELVREQREREPYINTVARVHFDDTVKEIDDFGFYSISISGYENYHPSMAYPVAV